MQDEMVDLHVQITKQQMEFAKKDAEKLGQTLATWFRRMLDERENRKLRTFVPDPGHVIRRGRRGVSRTS